MQKALKTLQTLGLPVYYRGHRSDWAKEPVLPWATVWVTPHGLTLVEVGSTADRDGLSSSGPPNVYGRGRGMQSRVPSVDRCASGTGDYTSDAVKALPKRSLLFDTAWRTAYLLGIETCRVELIYAGGRWQIYDIGPGLSGLSKKDVSERDLTERERTRSDPFVKDPIGRDERIFIDGDGDEEEKRQAITLGVDIEALIVLDNRKVQMASHFFPRHGAIGTDALIYRDRRGVGRNPVLEIRLKPADSARALLNELHQKLTEVQKYLKYKQKIVANKTIALLAGCAPHPAFSLGGHLHARGVPLTIEWIRRFDLYLALPLLALAPETCAARLKRYGYLGDIRFKPHGGFEYRTLPSWIVDPSLARYVLLMWEALVRSMKQVRQGLIFSATEDAVRIKHHAMIWQKLARIVPHYDPARKEDAQRMRTYARTVVGDLYERLQHEDFRHQYERLYHEHLQYERFQQEHLQYERLQMEAPSISSVSMVETMSLKEIFSKEWYMCFLQSLRWMLARLEEGWRWKEQEDIFPRWNAVNSYVGEDR